MEKTKTDTKKLVVTAILIALGIVLARYLGITTDTVKITFAFLPLSTAAALYGPVWGGFTFALADVLGMLIAGGGKTYFFPFTVSEILYGVIYGLVLHGREKNLHNVTIAVALSTLTINLGLTPLWNVLYMKMFMGKSLSYAAVWLTKLVPALILIPVRIVSIYSFWHYIGKHIREWE